MPIQKFFRACIAVGVMAAISQTAIADETWSHIKDRGVVRIGVNLSGLPFGTYATGTQQPIGFAVELAEDIGKKLGVKTEVVPVVAANRAVFLQQGKVDLLIANMTVTPERAEQLDYVPTPYEQLGGALVTPRNSGINRWEDLRGKTVCISQGASFQQPLTRDYGVVLKAFRTQSDVLLALRGQSCDGVVLNSPIMHEMVRQPEWAQYEIPIAQDLVPADSVIWIRKQQPQTQQVLDRIVRDWHGSGWLLEEGRKYQMVASPMVVELHERYRNEPRLSIPVTP